MLGPPGGMKEVGSSTVVRRSASASEPGKGKGWGGLMCLHTQSSMSASSEVAPWQAHAASARMLACEHTQTEGGGVCGMGGGLCNTPGSLLALIFLLSTVFNK